MEVCSMAIYNFDIRTTVQMGPLSINTLDHSNCYHNDVVDIQYDSAKSTIYVNGTPTYKCSMLTRANLVSISVVITFPSMPYQMESNFDVAQFSFDKITTAGMCTPECEKGVFALMKTNFTTAFFVLTFDNSARGGIMRFPVHRIRSKYGKICFTNFITTIAPSYVGTSFKLLQLGDCQSISAGREQVITLQVLVFDERISSIKPAFQWKEEREFRLITDLCFLSFPCHDTLDPNNPICNYLTQLIMSNHVISSELVLTFPPFKGQENETEIVLRYPIRTTKSSVWRFVYAYVGGGGITFVLQRITNLIENRMSVSNKDSPNKIIRMSVYLQDKKTHELDLIMSVTMPIEYLLLGEIYLPCKNSSGPQIRVCMQKLMNLRKNWPAYTMLLNFGPPDKDEVKFSYLITFISIYPIITDFLWQFLLLVSAICIYAGVLFLMSCLQTKIRLG